MSQKSVVLFYALIDKESNIFYRVN